MLFFRIALDEYFSTEKRYFSLNKLSPFKKMTLDRGWDLGNLQDRQVTQAVYLSFNCRRQRK
jgi:hypothetical protein